MDALLTALGGSHSRYWFAAACAAAILLWSAWAGRPARPWWYAVALGLAVFAFRWPIAIGNGEQGVDESQIAAGAMTLRERLVPWGEVDLNTCGPLNALPLAALGRLGVPIEFSTLHLFGLVCVCLALTGGYVWLRAVCDERVARCAVFPATAFFALSTFFDFVHYTSEHLSLALLTWGAAGLWWAMQRGKVWPLFAGMTFLGAVPWAKLQGTPVALWLSLAGGIGVVWRWRGEIPRCRRLLGAWFAGGTFVTLGFAVFLVSRDLGTAWKVAYIDQALQYTGAGRIGLGSFLTGFPRYASEAGAFGFFFWPLALLGLVLTGWLAWSRVPASHRSILIVLGGNLVASVYAVAAPGRPFFHYLLYLVLPLALLVGALLDAAKARIAGRGERSPSGRRAACANAALLAFLVVGVAPQVTARLNRPHGLIPFRPEHRRLHPTEVSRWLTERARPGDTLSVWGWLPRLYVESRLACGTRDGQTERQIELSPLRDYYRARYLRDLERHRPRFFVEAVGPGQYFYQNRATAGIESWPELNQLIADRYRFVGEFEGCRVFEAKASWLEAR